MSDEENGLDNFLTTDNQSPKQAQTNETSSENFDLEDEFTKLLNDFITEGTNKPESQEQTEYEETASSESTLEEGLNSFVDNKSTANEITSLDDFTNLTETNKGTESLDGYVDKPVEQTNASGLDGFVSENSNLQQDNSGLDGFITEEPSAGELDGFITNEGDQSATADGSGLKEQEKELARAVSNFQDGMNAIISKKNMKSPRFDYNEDMLKPNYKPSVGKKIAQYLLDCWDIINKYDPENMKKLSPKATDEDYLIFAENLNDTYLQLVIISYVEILINIESCEITYEQKREMLLKNRIKKELYEEYLELQERKRIFIEKLKEKNFPIDVDKLINNYFRVAQKDADGAFEALTKNPATFSPIEIEKIQPKLFGLIKVTPEDGIKANQKIGNFIKNLKV